MGGCNKPRKTSTHRALIASNTGNRRRQSIEPYFPELVPQAKIMGDNTDGHSSYKVSSSLGNPLPAILILHYAFHKLKLLNFLKKILDGNQNLISARKNLC